MALSPTQRQALVGLCADQQVACSADEPLAPRTTWRIGGPAEVLLTPTQPAAAAAVIAWCRAEGVPWRALGGGSNLLVPDIGMPGVTLALANGLTDTQWGTTQLVAGAGCFLPKLAREAASRGLSGLECVAGVPGTVGGGCVTNAGIPAGTLSDTLVNVAALDASGEFHLLPAATLALAHRDSRFRHEPWLILAATFDLQPGDPAEITAALRRHLDYRRRTQPLNQPTCGSVFARPPSGEYPGALIEYAGCKGWQRGAAQVSEKHANWIVNLGGASAADVRALIEAVQARVAEVTGVELRREVEIWE